MPVVRIVGQLPEGVRDPPHVTAASPRSHGLRSPKAAAGSSHKSASDDADFIARDTVVRYNQGPSPHQIARKQPGIKYYTDLKDK